MIDYLCQSEILLLNKLKFLKILGFLFNFSQIPIFFLYCQIPGFYRFSGKMTTLYTTKISHDIKIL